LLCIFGLESNGNYTNPNLIRKENRDERRQQKLRNGQRHDEPGLVAGSVEP
jgi:hypothetical protein